MTACGVGCGLGCRVGGGGDVEVIEVRSQVRGHALHTTAGG